MIKIKLNEEIDFNQVNDYVINKINKMDISWLPTYKDTENENFLNYKIKQIADKAI